MLATGARSRKKSREGRFAELFATLLACALFAAMLVFAVPPAACAADVACTQVDIVARAQTDGSLHVTERRTIATDGGPVQLKWAFGGPSAGLEAEISSVRAASIDQAGNVDGEWQVLPAAPFQTKWRDAGGPDHGAWSFDRAKSTVYAFLEESNGRAVLEMEYVVADGVAAYDDVAEILWRYVPEGWTVDSEDVALTIELPVPSAEKVVPGSNVRAWGHGPSNGEVSVQEDGTVVYRSALVSAGQYAEAHVTFPVNWLSNLDKKARLANQGTTRLGAAIAEEDGWADQENNRRAIDDALVAGSFAICALVLATALVLCWFFGRELRPDFTGKYMRRDPAPDLHPALVGRLWRWNRESSDDFAASVMNLAHTGVLRLERATSDGADSASAPDFCLVPDEEMAAKLTDPIDRLTLEVLFDDMGGDPRGLWLAALRKIGEEEPAAYAAAMGRWQHRLSEEVAERSFFDKRSMRLRTVVFAAALALVVVAVGVQSSTGSLISPVAFVATAAALVVVGNYMPRRTLSGNETVAHCKAMRNYIRDLGFLGDLTEVDGEDGPKLLLYAYLFGVESATIERVAARFAGEGSAAFAPGSPGEWFVRATDDDDHGKTDPAPFEALSATLARTISNARTSISEANAAMSGAGRFARRRCDDRG